MLASDRIEYYITIIESNSVTLRREAPLSRTGTKISKGRARIEEKERAILNAARSAFIKNGFHGAKVADIAKAAGISEGSVYFHFTNKDELMHAVLSNFWEDPHWARFSLSTRRLALSSRPYRSRDTISTP